MKRITALLVLLLASAAGAQTIGPAVIFPFTNGSSTISGVTVGTTTTAGTAICTISPTITGGSATSNFLNCTGTGATTLTAESNGVVVDYTGAGSSAFLNGAMKINYNSGYTGSSGTYGLRVSNGMTSAGGVFSGVDGPGNIGAQFTSSGTGANYNVGVLSYGNSSTATGMGGVFIGNYGGLSAVYSTTGTYTLGAQNNAALSADNKSNAVPIFIAADNGSAVWRIADNGYIQGTMGEVGINADYTNATATFSNTALSVAVVSGRTYSIDVNLLVADSTAADGMKIDFAGGAATATLFRINCFSTNDTTGATVAFTASTSNALATVLNIAAMASTGTHMVRCSGTFVPSSSNTFTVRAAQNAHTTGTLTIFRGSWMSVRDTRPL